MEKLYCEGGPFLYLGPEKQLVGDFMRPSYA